MIRSANTWRGEQRLGRAAMTMVHVIEAEAIGWDADEPQGDDDELDVDVVVTRWFGKTFAAAYRELKDAARG